LWSVALLLVALLLVALRLCRGAVTAARITLPQGHSPVKHLFGVFGGKDANLE
jgi:hypothetical protein